MRYLSATKTLNSVHVFTSISIFFVLEYFVKKGPETQNISAPARVIKQDHVLKEL